MTRICIPDAELSILRALGEYRVEYLLIGGHAMRFYGSARNVHDVDILTGRSTTNAERLYGAIGHFIGHTAGFAEADLQQANKKVLFRNDGYDFEILTSVEGLAFDEAYARREVASQGDVSISVASRRDLIFIKRVAAERVPERRDFELEDIEVLDCENETNQGAG